MPPKKEKKEKKEEKKPATISPEKQEEYLKKYYESFSLAKIPNKKKVLRNQELFLLHEKPKLDKGKEIPHMKNIEPHAIYQADLLYMPADKPPKKRDAFKYILVVVDVGTGYTDAVPLIKRDSPYVLAAYKTIINREPLKNNPKFILQVDSGSEFKSVFKDYLEKDGVRLRLGKVGRSRQQAIVEARNKTIATALFNRMTAQELLTNEQSNAWVRFLPDVIKAINATVDKKLLLQNKDQLDKKDTGEMQKVKDNTLILQVGQKVRVMLDKPKDILGKKLMGNFRNTDTRWDTQPSVITNVIYDVNQPVLYQVDDKPTSYTFNQLQVVDSNEQAPPASVIDSDRVPNQYVVAGIEDYKDIDSRGIQYLLRWKGYPNKKDWTWQYRDALMNTTSQPWLFELIKNFEKKHDIVIRSTPTKKPKEKTTPKKRAIEPERTSERISEQPMALRRSSRNK